MFRPDHIMQEICEFNQKVATGLGTLSRIGEIDDFFAESKSVIRPFDARNAIFAARRHCDHRIKCFEATSPPPPFRFVRQQRPQRGGDAGDVGRIAEQAARAADLGNRADRRTHDRRSR